MGLTAVRLRVSRRRPAWRAGRGSMSAAGSCPSAGAWRPDGVEAEDGPAARRRERRRRRPDGAVRAGRRRGARGRGRDLHGPRRDGLGPDADRGRGRRGSASEGEDGVAAILAAGAAAAAQLAALDDELLAARAADVLDVADRIARHPRRPPDRRGDAVRAGDRRRRRPVAVADRDAAARAHPRDRCSRAARRPPTPRSSPGRTGSRRSSVCADCPGARWPRPAPDAEARARRRDRRGRRGARRGDRRRFDARAARARARPRGAMRRGGVAAGRHDATASRSRCSRTSARRPRPGRPARSGRAASACSGPSSCSSSGPTPPTEDEQAAAYREAVEAFGGDPVTIRLLDIGGDKPIPYLPLPAEENPFLGVRALRLAHDRPGAVRHPAAGLLPGRRRRARSRSWRRWSPTPATRRCCSTSRHGRGRSSRRRASRSATWTSA